MRGRFVDAAASDAVLDDKPNHAPAGLQRNPSGGEGRERERRGERRSAPFVDWTVAASSSRSGRRGPAGGALLVHGGVPYQINLLEVRSQ